MKIVVASGFEAGTNYAHVINTVKHADAFAQLGHQVTIVCRCRERMSNKKLNSFYGLHPTIRWIMIPSKIMGVEIDQQKFFSLLVCLVLLFIRPDKIYSRSFYVPIYASKLGFSVYAEAHAHLDNRTKPFLDFVKASHHRSFKKWITISNFLKKGYVKLGAKEEKIHVLPDAVDFDKFSKRPHTFKSILPENRVNILYAGHLYDYKGIPEILKAAKQLPDFLFHLVGGLDADIERQRERIRELKLENVVLHGMRPHTEIPMYLWSADVLLLTHTMNHPSAHFTSPVKLGEYLASGTPIIVADIPALRDWVSEKEVWFYEADNEICLTNKLREVIKNGKETANTMRYCCIQLANNMSYKKRANEILYCD